MRAYAAGQARDIDSKGEQDAAIGRLLDHYLHTAAGASLALNLGLREEDYLGVTGPGVQPEQITSHQQAKAWFEAEHHVLLAAIALACQAGFDRHAWQLPWAIALFLALWGHYQEWAAIERTALAAATRLGDPTGQAVSSRHLAHACLRLGDYHSALSYFERALALFQPLGDRLGEALVQQGLAAAAERQGRCADAVGHCEQALRLWELLGNKAGQARMLNNAGWNLVRLGNYQRARTLCERALALSAEVGELETQCHAWDSLGFLEHQLGNFGAAIACYQRALDFGRGMGAPVHEADTAARLGDAHVAAGDLRRGADAWRQALSVLDDLKHPDADGVRAKLAGLGGLESR
jgi:tetratricopeptide (TPR) repeat protein